MELSNLTTVTKINYPNIATYDYSATFDDVVTLKLKYIFIYNKRSYNINLIFLIFVYNNQASK
jgi:hypothetical protein